MPQIFKKKIQEQDSITHTYQGQVVLPGHGCTIDFLKPMVAMFIRTQQRLSLHPHPAYLEARTYPSLLEYTYRESLTNNCEDFINVTNLSQKIL